MMKKNLLKIRAFTILELLVAMGLLSVIMFALTEMLDQSQKSMRLGVSKMDVVEEARIVLDQIENDITCLDYKSAVEKAKRPEDDPLDFAMNNTFVVTKNGSTVQFYTTRAGRMPRFCQVKYEYNSTKYTLGMSIQTYDESNGTWRKEADRILLTNVQDFHIEPEYYEELGKYKYLKKVTVELKLIDSETRELGYSTFSDKKEKKINSSVIVRKIGGDAFEARAARFSRVVSLEPPGAIE